MASELVANEESKHDTTQPEETTMFGAIVRAALVLVAGSLLALTLSMAGGEFVDTHEDVAQHDGEQDRVENWQWADRVVTWFPAVAIATIVAILIGSAIERRRRTQI
jgi:hypothetical protein